MITSNYSVNKIFEEDYIADFTLDNGLFSTNGQYFIMQHAVANQNIITLNNYSDLIDGTIDGTNYFTKEIRWSFDGINWTTFTSLISTNNQIVGFPINNTNLNTWIHIKYTWNTDLITPKIAILKEVELIGKRKVDSIFEPIVIKSNPLVFTNTDTYKVFSMQDFKVYSVNNDNTGINIQFRYTQSQGRQWSEWMRLTVDNLISIKFDPIKFCNFQFGFQNTTSSPWSLYDLELIGEFQNITAAYATTSRLGLKSQCNPLLTTLPPTGPCDPNCTSSLVSGSNTCLGNDGKSCCAACSESDTPWSLYSEDCGIGSNTDKLYKKNSRKNYGKLPELNNYLNNTISVMNGWTVNYYLTDPDKKGSDVILHEYQLYNVLQMKDINVLVPGNNFPTADITLSSLDLDLIQTFEIHIVKDQFKKIFGVEFRPGSRDIIYFCDMNQLWEVDQMIPVRKAFNTETYWRVRLMKYNDRASRKFNNTGDKALVDALTKHTSLDSLFGIQQDAEIQRVSKNANVKIDNMSQQYSHQSSLTFIELIDSSVQYTTDIIYNSSLTLSESQYKLPLTSKGKKLITYKHKDRSVKKGDNRAISMWFNTEKYNPVWDYSLLSNFDYTLQKGYKLDLVNNSLNFQFNTNIYQLPLNNLLEPNVWYCIFVNLYQVQEELELVIYKRQNEDGLHSIDSKLVQVVKMIWQITPDSFSHIEDIFIGGVDLQTNNSTGVANFWSLTNIRIYNQQIAKNKRNIVLNEKVVKDSHLTLLVDNADNPNNFNQNYGNI